jgi:hypothetical protein
LALWEQDRNEVYLEFLLQKLVLNAFLKVLLYKTQNRGNQGIFGILHNFLPLL